MKHLTRLTALTALLLGSLSAQAAAQTFVFSGTLDSGYYSGGSYSGSFSFDDAALIGVGEEWLNIDSLSIDLLGMQFTLADADVPAEVAYVDGIFRGLSYSASTSDPQFSLIAGSFDASEAYFAYDTVLGLSGTGNLIYAPVPEPSTWAMLLMGVGLVGLKLRSRTQSSYLIPV